MSVQEALLQAHVNARRGLRDTAILDLAKAYDRVDRETSTYGDAMAAKKRHPDDADDSGEDESTDTMVTYEI